MNCNCDCHRNDAKKPRQKKKRAPSSKPPSAAQVRARKRFGLYNRLKSENKGMGKEELWKKVNEQIP